jgi:ABC-2 type transport system ATP-binding protein
LAFYRRLWGDLPKADDLLRRLDLEPGMKAKHLSTGNHQKLGLVLAMARSPKLLVLDEPTRGLDPLLQHEFELLISQYRQEGGTVFISSHNLSEVERLCDEVGIIKDGRMVATRTMAELRRMQIHLVTLTMEREVATFRVPAKNTDIVRAEGNQLIVKVHGDINPLVRQIAKEHVKDIEITHLPLEDVFMEFYRSNPSQEVKI